MEIPMTDFDELEADVLWETRIDEMARTFVAGWPERDDDDKREIILADCSSDARMTAEVAMRIAALSSPDEAMKFLAELSSLRRATMGLPRAA